MRFKRTKVASIPGPSEPIHDINDPLVNELWAGVTMEIHNSFLVLKAYVVLVTYLLDKRCAVFLATQLHLVAPSV